MKKTAYLIISLLMAGMIGLTSCNSHIKYPSGKDTRMSFGDGTYQIAKGDDCMPLFYAPVGFPIIEHVTDVYETETRVYIIGEHRAQKNEVVAVINLTENRIFVFEDLKTDQAKPYCTASDLAEEGVINHLSSFYDFPNEDQTIFRDQDLFSPVQ